jgi:hypothetical protein
MSPWNDQDTRAAPAHLEREVRRVLICKDIFSGCLLAVLQNLHATRCRSASNLRRKTP